MQATEKLKKIRAQRRIVKKHEIEFERLSGERKIAKEEYDASLEELGRLIDDAPQGDLFAGHGVQSIALTATKKATV